MTTNALPPGCSGYDLIDSESTNGCPPYPLALVVVEFDLDGWGSLELLALVDTGADRCCLSPWVLDLLPFKTPASGEVFSIIRTQGLGLPARLSLDGGQSWYPPAPGDSSLIVDILPESEWQYPYESGDMLIGRNLLEHLILTYDGPARRFSLQTAPRPAE